MGQKRTAERELIHGELSYKLAGGLFDLHNEVGPGFREECNQRAFARWLDTSGIPFVGKPHTRRPVVYKGREVDILEPDFDISGKLILELKAKRGGTAPADEAQTLNYIKHWHYDLGILVNMGRNEVHPKRLPYTAPQAQVCEDYSAIKPIMTDSLRSVTEACRQSLLTVYREVGVGYTAQIYRQMILVELAERRLSFDAEVVVAPQFQGEAIVDSPITSVLVEGQVIVEVTAICDHVSAADRRTVQTYLKFTEAKVGLIGCFSRTALIIRGIRPPSDALRSPPHSLSI